MPSLTRHAMHLPVSERMRRSFPRLRADYTVAQALSSIREQAPREGAIVYFYVVDPEDHLLGVIPTRRLLLNPADAKIGDIMVQKVMTLSPNATGLDVNALFVRHRLLAFPVVSDGKIVGVIDADAYVDPQASLSMRERVDNLFQMIGVHLAESQQASAVRSFQARFPWLLCNIVGGLVAAFVSWLFEDELKQAVVLALFTPVVLALAESVSVQSLSLALQIGHGERPTIATLTTWLRREAATGLLLALACAATVALVALAWIGERWFAACLFTSITAGVTMAAIIGFAMPNLLRIFRFDPRIAAGPIALASSDMVALVAYLVIARILI